MNTKNKDSIISSSSISRFLFLFMFFYYVVLAYPIDIMLHSNYLRYSDSVLVIAILFGVTKVNFKMKSLIYIILLVICVIMSHVSSLDSEIYLAFRQIRFIVIGYLTVITIKRIYTNNFYKKINNLVMVCTVLSCLWLLRQYLFGWTSAEEVWIIQSMNSNPDISYIGTTRFFATFPYANNASLFFALSLLIALKNLSKSILYKVGMYFSILGIVLVQMKIGYFVGVFILLCYIRKINKFQLVFMFIMLIFAVSQFDSKFFEYTLNKINDNSMIKDSVSTRWYQISKNLERYSEKPISFLIGNGYGKNTAIAYIDNLYFSYFYQNGLISTIILISIMRNYIKYVINYYDEKKFVIVFLIISGLYSLTSCALDSSVLFYILTIYLGIFLKIALLNEREIKRNNR